VKRKVKWAGGGAKSREKIAGGEAGGQKEKR